MDQECKQEEKEKETNEGSENSQILQLMAKYSQLKDLLYAHRITGIYYIFFLIVYFHFCVHTRKILTSVFYSVVIRRVQPRKDSPRQRCLYFSGNSLQRRLHGNLQPGVKSEAKNDDRSS